MNKRLPGYSVIYIVAIGPKKGLFSKKHALSDLVTVLAIRLHQQVLLLSKQKSMALSK